MRPACGSKPISVTASRRDAASSTAPAAVTHERCGAGERKKFTTASDVCVSSSSANHPCHCTHRSSRRWNRSIMWARRRISTPEAVFPVNAASCPTITSRFENAE